MTSMEGVSKILSQQTSQASTNNLVLLDITDVSFGKLIDEKVEMNVPITIFD